jgi:hypothetical protein
MRTVGYQMREVFDKDFCYSTEARSYKNETPAPRESEKGHGVSSQNSYPNLDARRYTPAYQFRQFFANGIFARNESVSAIKRNATVPLAGTGRLYRCLLLSILDAARGNMVGNLSKFSERVAMNICHGS